MTNWRCRKCRAQVAPGAPRCPHCPSTEFDKPEAEMLKIARDGTVSDSADAVAVQEHPGTGEPMTGVEHPADGTWSPEVTGDAADAGLYMIGEGEGVPGFASGLEVLKTRAEGAAADAEAATEPAIATAPPRVPPRRTPPGVAGA